MFGRGSCRAIVSRVNVLMILPSSGFLCMLVPVYHPVVCPVRFFLLIRTRALRSLTKKQVSEYTDYTSVILSIASCLYPSLSLRTDAKGIICDQRGVFRVNCMDCLDRTNVVQAALARHIMEQQVTIV